ncbi:FAD/NAD(P)-binding protein [Sphingobacterium hotanense]|uniref:FAD/NAD(P)-binding protein n=1 Tax=Sphingobacterium hotanense TaxID=649196 RepID=UPI0011F23C3A|nr:FAD/NAD(P)-binding protein [Sphingobacterium hotanense]
MIWNSSSLNSELLNLPNELKSFVKSVNQLPTTSPSDFHIAIVGAGPKGFYALDTFQDLANKRLGQSTHGNQKIHIHWFNNDYHFGTGPNFHTDLPEYFLVNRYIADITCWEEVVKSDIPHQLSLMQWLKKHSISGKEPAWNHLCTRELLGYYFIDAVLSIMKEENPMLEIHLVKERICDLDIGDDKSVLTCAKGKIPFHYDSVILATGHSYESTSFSHLKQDANASYTIIDEVYPIERLSEIPAREDVAIYGTGLTFLDAMLELTEGRGGIFYKKDDEYHYLSSGHEPIMYPFSRRNLPNMPVNAYSNSHKRTLAFMTDEWLENLLAQNRKIDFINEIIPILDLEVKFAFYPLIPEFKGLDNESILAFLHDDSQEKMFSLFALVNPMSYSKLPSDTNYQEFILDLSNYCLQMTEFGEFHSPMAAATAALREAFEQIVKINNQVGFTANSQKAFEDRWFPNINHLAYGPPREVSEKFFCLMREGFVKFIFSETASVTQAGNKIRLKNKYMEKDFQYLLNARIQKGNLRTKNHPLYDRMLSKGIIKEWMNDQLSTGKIAIDKNGKPVGLDENHKIYLYGIPTEGQVISNDTILRSRNNFAKPWADDTFATFEKKCAELKERML